MGAGEIQNSDITPVTSIQFYRKIFLIDQSNSQSWNKIVFPGQINTTMREMFEEYPSCNAL